VQLISEITHDTTTQIVESTKGEKEYFIEGIFMQSDLKNRNGRIYPKPVMEGQVKAYNESFVGRKRALGELGHPDNPAVNLERVSHNITTLEYKNNTDVHGKAKLMDTPYGNIAKSFVREGVELGVSSRGLGSIKESSGTRVVQNDFFLSAIDIVADPSAPSAFVNGIMEGKEWILVDGVLVEEDLDKLQNIIDAESRTKDAKFAESNVFSNLDIILANAHRLNESEEDTQAKYMKQFEEYMKKIESMHKRAKSGFKKNVVTLDVSGLAGLLARTADEEFYKGLFK